MQPKEILFFNVMLNGDFLIVYIDIVGEKIDQDIVASELPRGNVSVEVTKGGMNVVDEVHDTVSVIATVAIEACLEVPPGTWKVLSN